MSRPDDQDEVGKMGGDFEESSIIRRWLDLAREIVKPDPRKDTNDRSAT